MHVVCYACLKKPPLKHQVYLNVEEKPPLNVKSLGHHEQLSMLVGWEATTIVLDGFACSQVYRAVSASSERSHW